MAASRPVAGSSSLSSNSSARPWFGPLSLAPAALRETLAAAPTFQALLARHWEPSQTLVFAPPRRTDYELDVCAVARMFAWDEKSPVIWLLSSIGLCQVAQLQRPRRSAFRRFELVLACSGGLDDPFPHRLGVALSMEDWDWNQVTPPPLMDWLTIASEELGISMKTGAHFAITDTITLGPGKNAWTRSVLEHSMLLPVPPHMLVSGIAPFDRTSVSAGSVSPLAWDQDPGVERYEYGYYWLLPISEPEHAQANQVGSWSTFGDLSERSRAQTGDPFALAFDLLRP